MFVPPGSKIIKNIAYRDRVADLFEFNPNGYIVGHPYNGGQNQKFNFEKVGVDQYKISTSSSTGPAYVTSDPMQDAPVTAGGATVYTVTPADGGNFHISVKNNEGQSLYWTLVLENHASIITLQHGGVGTTQIWNIYNV